MSALLDAVGVLEQSVNGLESTAEDARQRMVQVQNQAQSGGQQDMFGGAAANANGTVNIDPAVLARKLDVAIERVEQVLKEG